MKAYILDLDGVIYRGSNPIDGAVDAVNRLQDRAKMLFLTNNSTRSRSAVAARLDAAGIRCGAGDVITAGYAAAVYIRKRYGASAVYPIGEAGLIEELKAEGHVISEDAEFVVVGLDRDLNYEKLRIGLQNITNGARFIATNTDPVLPTEDGFVPGAGAIVSALETASGQSPLVIGKPNQPIMDIVIDHRGLDAEECIVVGDRLDTDILAGIRCGMRTVLVLTGVETRDSLRRSDIEPDLVIESITELLAAPAGGDSRVPGKP
ncbi:MAG: HAD-IIA family hydrolase [Methanosarcinales archaeon]|nr:HAD-IIA family hydrolase [Methanosarcinales archaeon]